MRRVGSLAERFSPKVVKTSCCWIWRGSRNADGYGYIASGGARGRSLKAHRVSWRLHRGPIPDGLCVLHNCPCGDNPACVNPQHLWLGTHADNMRDMFTKGRRQRTARGASVATSRLTESDVIAIRYARSMAGASGPVMAKAYGVTPASIYRAISGRSWAHLVGHAGEVVS